ncbi:MAG: globin [Anaerolineae bacterium]|nr:globin [Anaerolineae bacterium]
MSHPSKSIFEVIGMDGFERLVAAFYQRVTDDPVLRPLYPDADMTGAERRLRMFLIQYFGGPQDYSAERGHPRLRMRHVPFKIGQAERDAWVTAMLGALDDADIPEPANTTMREYFQGAATFLINDASYFDTASNA